jgi:Pregnancy-associated plasma protein-A
MMYKNNVFFTLLLVLLGLTSVTAQSYRFQQESLPCVNKKFTIIAHIFSDSLGLYGTTEAGINNAVSGMNVFFSPLGVSFEVCEFRYHPNFEHDTLDTPTERDVIVTKYNVQNRINFYFLNELNFTEAGFAFGVIGVDKTGIFIKKSEGITTSVFAHEMGHYCGLKHTFEGNGTELVDGSNCLTEGDGICDTPADPYVPGEPKDDYVLDCKFISEKTDANGEYYNPDIGNVMSYYNCGPCGFTWEQLNKMGLLMLSNAMRLW